jgi:hypothetical protein
MGAKIIRRGQKIFAKQDGKILLNYVVSLHGGGTESQMAEFPLNTPIIPIGKKGHALSAI